VTFAAGRRSLLALAVVSGLISGALYYAATRQTDVVVMARDVTDPRPLTQDDLMVRAVASELAPDLALRSVDDALGLTPRVPVLRGQILFASALAVDPVELRGWSLGVGRRAVAIPGRVVDAVGGAVSAGARVDVLALPIAGRAPTDRTAEILLVDAPVLDVRAESGAPYVRHDDKAGLLADRLSSVVIGIAAADEARLADRLATSTFVIVLAGSSP
jgi:Flp pilus assembly protein CpaB